MQKLKTIKLSNILPIVKAGLVAVIITLGLVVLFAVLLKFVDTPNWVVAYMNNIIKAISLFVAVAIIKRVDGQKLILKAVCLGVIYAVLSFVVFSIINGSFNFGVGFLYDLLFAVLVAVVASIFVNIFGKKTT